MIAIDERSMVPVYQQIINGIIGDINNKNLKPNDRLPAVRKMAQNLDVAPGTVAKAYADLERLGFAASRGRRGTFVVASTDPRYEEANEAARHYLSQIKRLGLTDREAIDLLVRVLDS